MYHLLNVRDCYLVAFPFTTSFIENQLKAIFIEVIIFSEVHGFERTSDWLLLQYVFIVSVKFLQLYTVQPSEALSTNQV